MLVLISLECEVGGVEEEGGRGRKGENRDRVYLMQGRAVHTLPLPPEVSLHVFRV